MRGKVYVCATRDALSLILMGCTCLDSCKMSLCPTYTDHFYGGGARKHLHNPVFADKVCIYFIGLGGRSLKMSLISYICQLSPTYIYHFYGGGARQPLHNPVFADKGCIYFIGLGGKSLKMSLYSYKCQLSSIYTAADDEELYKNFLNGR